MDINTSDERFLNVFDLLNSKLKTLINDGEKIYPKLKKDNQKIYFSLDERIVLNKKTPVFKFTFNFDKYSFYFLVFDVKGWESKQINALKNIVCISRIRLIEQLEIYFLDFICIEKPFNENHLSYFGKYYPLANLKLKQQERSQEFIQYLEFKDNRFLCLNDFLKKIDELKEPSTYKNRAIYIDSEYHHIVDKESKQLKDYDLKFLSSPIAWRALNDYLIKITNFKTFNTYDESQITLKQRTFTNLLIKLGEPFNLQKDSILYENAQNYLVYEHIEKGKTVIRVNNFKRMTLNKFYPLMEQILIDTTNKLKNNKKNALEPIEFDLHRYFDFLTKKDSVQLNYDREKKEFVKFLYMVNSVNFDVTEEKTKVKYMFNLLDGIKIDGYKITLRFTLSFLEFIFKSSVTTTTHLHLDNKGINKTKDYNYNLIRDKIINLVGMQGNILNISVWGIYKDLPFSAAIYDVKKSKFSKTFPNFIKQMDRLIKEGYIKSYKFTKQPTKKEHISTEPNSLDGSGILMKIIGNIDTSTKVKIREKAQKTVRQKTKKQTLI